MNDATEIARRFANSWDGQPVQAPPRRETIWQVLPWCIGFTVVVMTALVVGGM